MSEAISLTVAERRSAVRDFFTRYSERGGPGIGLGRAVADFLDWEVESGRIADDPAGSRWWKAVNGMLVLDIRDAATGLTTAASAWRSYVDSPPGDGQRLLWEAHTLSIDTAVIEAAGLVSDEVEAEREFIGIVLHVLGRAAARGDSTDDDSLGKGVDRFYPKTYPISPTDLERLLGAAG